MPSSRDQAKWWNPAPLEAELRREPDWRHLVELALKLNPLPVLSAQDLGLPPPPEPKTALERLLEDPDPFTL